LKTKKLAIKPIAFQKKPYTDLSIKESERIIRQQKFVNSVTITVALPEEKRFCRCLYSCFRFLELHPKISLSAAKNSLGLKERNFFGIGHQLDYRYTYRSSDGKVLII
jgi:hypothetical protein